MFRFVSPVLAVLLSACASGGGTDGPGGYGGHEFIVDAGFGAESAILTLNGEDYPMEETELDVFAVRADPEGDASGRIAIVYNGDGATAYCAVGYVTGGDPEPHRYVVERLECREQ